MLDRRLRLRENPFPQERPACLDDLVFLPANLSRLVIDPYREACKISWRLGERLDLDIPFFVAGFDTASEELKVAVDRGVVATGAAYLGATRPGPNAPWLQLCEPGRDVPSHDAAGVVYRVGERWHPMPTARARAEQLLGLLLASRRDLEDAIVYALERGFDLLVLDGTGALGREWPELRAAPDLALVRDTIAILRRLKKEEMIDIACTTLSPRTCARSPGPLPPPPASRSRGHGPRSLKIAPPRGCGRPNRHESALTDSRRGCTEGNTQPFAYLVNILSRWLANDCRSLLLNAGGPPVCIPLARNVSMKSRMLSRWRMVSVE